MAAVVLCQFALLQPVEQGGKCLYIIFLLFSHGCPGFPSGTWVSALSILPKEFRLLVFRSKCLDGPEALASWHLSLGTTTVVAAEKESDSSIRLGRQLA